MSGDSSKQNASSTLPNYYEVGDTSYTIQYDDKGNITMIHKSGYDAGR